MALYLLVIRYLQFIFLRRTNWKPKERKIQYLWEALKRSAEECSDGGRHSHGQSSPERDTTGTERS